MLFQKQRRLFTSIQLLGEIQGRVSFWGHNKPKIFLIFNCILQVEVMLLRDNLVTRLWACWHWLGLFVALQINKRRRS